MIGVFTPEVLAGLPRDNDWLLTLQCVLEGALAVEDATIVSDVVDLLGPYSGRAVINAGAVMFHGVTDDTLGRAANLLGDRSEADRLSTAALATYDRIRAIWWRNRLRQAMGSSLTVRRVITTIHMHQQPGGLWLVGGAGQEISLPNLRGLHHLRALVAQPAVRKAIMAAIARIAEADPWLGRHLRDHVRTGSECRYESDPDHPIRWVLSA